MNMYKLSGIILSVSLGIIDLAKYQWFRKQVGGTWYYVGLLVDLGRQKIYWWTKTKVSRRYIIKTEEY